MVLIGAGARAAGCHTVSVRLMRPVYGRGASRRRPAFLQAGVFVGTTAFIPSLTICTTSARGIVCSASTVARLPFMK